MDHEEFTARVRTLRATGRSPKQIARALGVPPATVAPLIRTIAAEQQADVPEPQLIGCWVSPGWSDGLTITGHPEWPDATPATPACQDWRACSSPAGHVTTRSASAAGWSTPTASASKTPSVPGVMDDHHLAAFTRSFFAAYPGPPLPAPLDLAQHLVFGAVAYARDLGLEPARGFAATTGHLGPWAGPSAIQFGRDGKPLFIQGLHDDPIASSPRSNARSGPATSTSSSSAHSRRTPTPSWLHTTPSDPTKMAKAE